MNFSIVIPLYNKAPYVKETLLSVINQTKLPIELIIVDDKSTDEGLQIVHDYLEEKAPQFKDIKVEIIELEENRGVGFARNVGFIKTTGDVVSYLDADDLYSTDLIHATDILMTSHGVDFLAVGLHFFPSNGLSPNLEKLNQKLTPLVHDAYRMEEPLKVITSTHFLMGVGSNVFVKRKWMESITFYEEPNFYEGIDYWFRVLKEVMKNNNKSVALIMGNRLKVREVPGSASRKKFNHWNEIHYPPLLIECKGSKDYYDKLMMGVVGKRWLKYSVKNLNSVKQKFIFIFKYKHLYRNQLYYYFLRKLNK